MHYLAFLDLPGFYVREWIRRDPSRGEEPLAVHRDKRVIDLNPSAFLAGIRLGMRHDEAKLLLTGPGLIPYEEEPYRESQSRWLDVLAEFSSVIEPDDPHCAWADLSGHPDPYGILAEAADRIRQAIGLTPRTGISTAKWVARRSCALQGTPYTWEDWVERPGECLSDLSTCALDPVEPKVRERLKFLGYRTIGAVAAIPLRTLKSQFGVDALTVHTAANGRGREAVRPLYPPDSVFLMRTYQDGLTSLQSVQAALEALAKSVAFALSQRSAYGTKMELAIGLAARSQKTHRTLSRPIRTAQEVLSALTRIIGEPNEPIHMISVRMPRIVKVEERQAGLYAARCPGDDLAAARTVDRLRDAFGDRSIVRGSEVQVPRRVRVLRAWSHATGWK